MSSSSHGNFRRRKETYSIRLISLSSSLGFVMGNPQEETKSEVICNFFPNDLKLIGIS